MVFCVRGSCRRRLQPDQRQYLNIGVFLLQMVGQIHAYNGPISIRSLHLSYMPVSTVIKKN